VAPQEVRQQRPPAPPAVVAYQAAQFPVAVRLVVVAHRGAACLVEVASLQEPMALLRVAVPQAASAAAVHLAAESQVASPDEAWLRREWIAAACPRRPLAGRHRDVAAELPVVMMSAGHQALEDHQPES
jgi:hypothetical protein